MSFLKMKRTGQQKHSLWNKRFFGGGRLLLGVVFILASVDKILHPAAFAQLVNNYDILPHEIINLTAIIFPWLELIIGIFLVSNVWLPGCLLLTDILLGAFLGGILYNINRGLNIHCGCFTTNPTGDPAVMWHLVGDAALFILCNYLLYKIILQDDTQGKKE